MKIKKYSYSNNLLHFGIKMEFLNLDIKKLRIKKFHTIIKSIQLFK